MPQTDSQADYVKENTRLYEKLFGGGYDHTYPNENIVRLVKGFFGKGGTVLDYGFGPGENLIHLLRTGFNVVGLDVSENSKALAENKLKNSPEFNGKYELAVLKPDEKKLPFGDNRFDHILSNQVVYYLADEGKILGLLSEFKRILRPKGKLIISMMSRFNSHCVNGKLVAPNVYMEEHEKLGLKDYVYIVQDEAHARKLFSGFNIHEIGWFDNHYFGRSGHHFVILASNDK